MLHNINPVLSPDMLYVLSSMGHGDRVVIVDANFPAEGLGPLCVRADGSTASEILEAVLSVMPLDTYVDDPALCMQVVGDPTAVPEAVADFQRIIDATADAPTPITSVERFAFYNQAKTVFTVIQTGERRLYGNIILSKGVIE